MIIWGVVVSLLSGTNVSYHKRTFFRICCGVAYRLIPAIVRVFETHIAGTTPQEYTITGFVLIMNNKRS